MNIMRGIAGLAVAVALAACSTTYGDMGQINGGGVAAAAITSDTFRISARGNGMTDPVVIQDYSMLKAAETTLAAGQTHFAVISSRDATVGSTYRTSSTYTATAYGGIFSPGQNYNIVQPGEDLMIRVFTPDPGTSLPPNSFRAQEVFDAINPRVKRSR
jgi:hypothetical protein